MSTKTGGTMSDIAPVVLVVRHPDYSDDINVYGAEVKLVYIDLGSSFDSTPDSEEQAREWAQSVWGEVKDLPEDHPARISVRETIGYTVERYFDKSATDALLKAS